MGLIGDIIRTHERRKRRRELDEDGVPLVEDPTAGVEKKKGAWIFKVITYFAIIGLFVDVALAIVLVTGGQFKNFTLWTWIAVIAIICIGCLQSLTWIKLLMLGKNKAMSIVNLCFVAVNIIMWVISAVLFISILREAFGDGVDNAKLVTPINFVRAAMIITIQLSIATSIMSTILRVKKRWIPFQIILYISQLYIDFYLCALLLSFSVNGGSDNIFSITKTMNFIIQPYAWTLALIAFAYILITNAILKGGKRRRRESLLQRTGIADEIDEQNRLAEEQERELKSGEAPKNDQDPNAKLTKLKELLDQGLITQEEYDAKRSKIIEDL